MDTSRIHNTMDNLSQLLRRIELMKELGTMVWI